MLIIAHYGEIALKGKNRGFFEKKLSETLSQYFRVTKLSGRFLLETNNPDYQDILRRVYGLTSYSEVTEVDTKNVVAETAKLVQEKDFHSFRISASRSDKDFFLTSPELNQQIGSLVKGKVDLNNADLTCYLEVVNNRCFVYFHKQEGIGGLPLGVSGEGLVLLSGGIDSPVAAHRAMKRGLKVNFIHFHSGSSASVRKAEDVIKHLTLKARLYIVPFNDIQQKILVSVKPDMRVLLYRRFMIGIARKIGNVLITGDNLGQVASQTLKNLDALGWDILRPLLCWDKQEIVDEAKKIGTYNISIRPHQDCCSRFLPEHPATASSVKEVDLELSKLNYTEMIDQALASSNFIDFKL